MGRQQRYQRGETVDKAMRLFWRHGFSGTSMRDLETELDMRPGSIYANFGSKEGLYLEVLEQYAQYTGEGLGAAIEAQGSFLGGLRQFLHSLVIGDGVEPPGRACMLAKTLADLEPANAKLKGRAVELMAAFEQSLRELLAVARQRGELGEAADTDALARFIQIQITGIRAYAECGRTAAILQGHIEDVLAAIEHKAATNPTVTSC